MNKRGIELSVNFVIVVILAIITLIMGIIVVNTMLGQGQEFSAQIREETEKGILQLLIGSDELVSMPNIRAEITVNEVAQFPIAILADPGECMSKNFEVITRFSTAVNEQNVEKEGEVSKHMALWHFTDPQEYKIDYNDRSVFAVPIRADAAAYRLGWTYVFDVDVLCGGEKYGEKHKLYVRAG